MRCGYTGTGPVARIVWGGDPTEDDSEADGLAAAVNQGLSMGLSGIGYWGSDIGGFHSLFTEGRTSTELLVRWLEVGAFSPIMRTQAEGYPLPVVQDGAERAEVWSPEVLPHWRALARLRTQLYPYLWDASLDYQRTGTPMMRHLALAYPDEPAAWGRGDRRTVAAARFEYLLGDDLLVAPVVDMGATGRDVWLPPGEWVDFWDAVTYDPAIRLLRRRPATRSSRAAAWSTDGPRSAAPPCSSGPAPACGCSPPTSTPSTTQPASPTTQRW